jgi:hypothetical protein
MERTCVNLFKKKFVNFVSSCARYVHGESMCTGYVPWEIILSIMGS